MYFECVFVSCRDALCDCDTLILSTLCKLFGAVRVIWPDLSSYDHFHSSNRLIRRRTIIYCSHTYLSCHCLIFEVHIGQRLDSCVQNGLMPDIMASLEVKCDQPVSRDWHYRAYYTRISVDVQRYPEREREIEREWVREREYVCVCVCVCVCVSRCRITWFLRMKIAEGFTKWRNHQGAIYSSCSAAQLMKCE